MTARNAPHESFAEAVALHNQGVDGDREAVAKASRMFKEILSADPHNTLVEAYLGSVTAMLGRDHESLDEKFRLALEGLKLLDSAVAKEPGNTEIRSLRAYVCYNLPDMYFHRLTTAVEDFEFLASCCRNNKRVFPREFYWKILFDLGAAYKKLGRPTEAESAWKRLLYATRDSKYMELLRQEGFNISGYRAVDRKRRGGGWLAGKVTPVEDEEYREAKEMHRRALAGDRDAVLKAFAYFEKAHREKPQDHLITAYYADCLSMVGRDSEDHSTVFGNAIKAIIDFDKAVNASPDNIEIRLLRGNHSYRLPEVFFRRSATAMGDFEYLIRRYEQDNNVLDEATYLDIMAKLGEIYERLDMAEEAGQVWARLFGLTGDNRYLNRQRRDETGFDPEKAKSMNWQQALQEGIRLHNLGVAGNKKAARIAAALLAGVYKANPRNPLAKGYYGSSLALAGKYASNPGTMFSNGIKGLKLVREAVERDPENPRLRLLRGYLAYNLPETFFHLTGTAIADFRFLLRAYDRNNRIFSGDLYRQIMHDLGLAYQRIGEKAKAEKIWSRLAEKNPR